MSYVAFLFPGQGVQRVGMARDLYDSAPAVRRWLERASASAGVDLPRLCFEGPEEELTRTSNAQPAILAASVASLIALCEALGAPASEDGSLALPGPALKSAGVACAAGLSLGEYTALVCAGALPAVDAVRLVRQRGLFMEEAGEQTGGTMTSIIGLDRAAVDDVCREAGGVVVGANYNAPGQVVISGEAEAVARAAALARQRGARAAMPLKVGGAFHSPLMRPAAERLAVALTQAPIRDACIPVVANVTGDVVRTADEIRAALAAQVTGSVLWEDSVRRMAADGVTLFVEVGPGQVLSGLVRRILPGAATVQAGEGASIAEAAAAICAAGMGSPTEGV